MFEQNAVTRSVYNAKIEIQHKSEIYTSKQTKDIRLFQA